MRCLGLASLSSIEGSGEPKQMRRLARTFLAENSACSSAGYVERFCQFAISTKISWQNIVLSLNTHNMLSWRCGSASCFGFLDDIRSKLQYSCWFSLIINVPFNNVSVMTGLFYEGTFSWVAIVIRGDGKMTCSRIQRSASGELEPGTSHLKTTTLPLFFFRSVGR